MVQKGTNKVANLELTDLCVTNCETQLEPGKCEFQRCFWYIKGKERHKLGWTLKTKTLKLKRKMRKCQLGDLDLEACGQVATEGISRVVGWWTDRRTDTPSSVPP